MSLIQFWGYLSVPIRPQAVNIAMSIIVADYMTSQLGAIDDSGVLCPYVTDRVHLKQGIRLNEHLLIKKRRKKERKERMKNKTTTKQNKNYFGSCL